MHPAQWGSPTLVVVDIANLEDLEKMGVGSSEVPDHILAQHQAAQGIRACLPEAQSEVLGLGSHQAEGKSAAVVEN